MVKVADLQFRVSLRKILRVYWKNFIKNDGQNVVFVQNKLANDAKI